MLRVAINGFGRIGRNTLKAGWDRPDVSFIAINDLTEPKILAHLLKYDSVFHTWPHEISFDDHHVIIDGKKIPVVAETDPKKLPWKLIPMAKQFVFKAVWKNVKPLQKI